MKYWVRLSRSIFKLAALPFIRKFKPKIIESVLKDSLLLLTPETTDEICNFILKKQTAGGGFADRAGKGDLYYSLFGYFIAETFAITEVKEPLKDFVKSKVDSENLSGVHLYCAAILYSKLFGADATSLSLNHKIKQELKSSFQHISSSAHQNYSNFMGYLALYYLEDFLSLKNLLHQYKTISSTQHINTSAHQHISTSNLPCPVIAANSILRNLSNHTDPSFEKKIKSFLRPSGGFAAVFKAPCEDLLSTGVALYALKFIDADIRILKPECLSFIDNLYEDGGFRAVRNDFETDVEYTFYGLLALGALK